MSNKFFKHLFVTMKVLNNDLKGLTIILEIPRHKYAMRNNIFRIAKINKINSISFLYTT